MRPIQRIHPILTFFLGHPEAYLKFLNKDIIKDIDKYNTFVEQFEKIRDEWEDNYDYRFGQLLINLGIVQDSYIWHIEETDWLTEQGYFDYEDLHYWTSIYDANSQLLKDPITKSLKDLDINHIRAIKQYMFNNNAKLNPNYLGYFNKRIKEDEQNKG